MDGMGYDAATKSDLMDLSYDLHHVRRSKAKVPCRRVCRVARCGLMGVGQRAGTCKVDPLLVGLG